MHWAEEERQLGQASEARLPLKLPGTLSLKLKRSIHAILTVRDQQLEKKQQQIDGDFPLSNGIIRDLHKHIVVRQAAIDRMFSASQLPCQPEAGGWHRPVSHGGVRVSQTRTGMIQRTPNDNPSASKLVISRFRQYSRQVGGVSQPGNHRERLGGWARRGKKGRREQDDNGVRGSPGERWVICSEFRGHIQIAR